MKAYFLDTTMANAQQINLGSKIIENTFNILAFTQDLRARLNNLGLVSYDIGGALNKRNQSNR
jgi:hypothetical protein